jgi:hypothetical protein
VDVAVLPGGNPVTAPPTDTPTSPITADAPVLLTVVRPSTAKLSAEPSETGWAAADVAPTASHAKAGSAAPQADRRRSDFDSDMDNPLWI